MLIGGPSELRECCKKSLGGLGLTQTPPRKTDADARDPQADERGADGTRSRIAPKWTPVEGSLVPVPADPGEVLTITYTATVSPTPYSALNPPNRGPCEAPRSTS